MWPERQNKKAASVEELPHPLREPGHLVVLLKEKVPFYITNCVHHHSSPSRAGALSCSGWTDGFKPDTGQKRIARLAELLQFHTNINENVCTQHPWTSERLSDLKCSFSVLLFFQFQHWIRWNTTNKCKYCETVAHWKMTFSTVLQYGRLKGTVNYWSKSSSQCQNIKTIESLCCIK